MRLVEVRVPLPSVTQGPTVAPEPDIAAVLQTVLKTVQSLDKAVKQMPKTRKSVPIKGVPINKGPHELCLCYTRRGGLFHDEPQVYLPSAS